MSAPIPGNPVSVQTAGRAILLDDSITVGGPGLTIDSGESDSGNTPTYRIRKGTVLVKRTSTGRYVGADDANADAATAPTISSSGHSDGNGVISITGNHGTFSVTTSTGTGTEANNATDLNADAAFAAFYTATSGSGELTITARNVGAEEWFKVDSATMATASFTEDDDVYGTDPEVYITAEESSDLQDINGTAIHGSAPSLSTGYFDESQLLISGGAATSNAVWGEYRAVLTRKGCRFG